MQTISKILEIKFRRAFNQLDIPEDSPILLVEASKPEFGDFQINGVMGIAKKLKLNPRDLAQKVIDNVELSPEISKLEIAGPGFINIILDDNYLATYISNLNHENRFGAQLQMGKTKTVVIDYSSPNLAKEMHVGHLRSTVIGDCLASVFEYMGHKVIRQNHVGDWGTQFGMLIAYMIERIDDGTFEHDISDLEEFYRKAKVRFDEDATFADTARRYVVILQNWKNEGTEGEKVHNYWVSFKNASLEHCQEIYNKLKIKLTHEDIAPESMYNDALDNVINVLENKHLINVSNGAKCIFFADGELSGGETTPYIVQKQDGGYLYSTTDLAAIDYRVNQLKGDRVLYVVDARQGFHFKQLFIVGEKAGYTTKDTSLEHVAFGTMTNEDGKPFKTRTGGTVKLIELINEAVIRAKKIVLERNPDWNESDREYLANVLAIGAIKYADLSKNRESDYIFSFDKMLAFNGNTAPYLMYAYTRIQSLLRKLYLARSSFDVFDFAPDVLPVHGVAYQKHQISSSLSMEVRIDEEFFKQTKIKLTEKSEHKLALQLANFSDCLYMTAKECYPHYLCQYLYNLSVNFMQFYESCSILRAESMEIKNSRILLAHLTAQIIKTGLGLLGIETVERM